MTRRRVPALALLREAVRALLRHKSRSALTTLGITIGIAAVVWVVAIGRTGSARAQAELQNLGDNLVWVEAGSRNVAGVRTGTRGTTTLTLADADAILREVPTIRRLSPQIDGSVVAVVGNRNWTTRYRGVSPDYLPIKRLAIAEGAAFTQDDMDRASNVVLLGKTVRERLFGDDDPIGRPIRIGVTPFIVVGVLVPKGQTAEGRDQDDTLLLPYATAEKKLRNSTIGAWLDDILCSATSPETTGKAAAQITALLRERHRIGPDEDEDFNIRKPEELIKAQLQASETFATLLIAIASVALLVGGIGVMNVMLASVAERTTEIGLRLAVGATEGAVRTQFLAEAVVLSLAGGMLGVVVSVVGSYGLERAMGWSLSIPPSALLLAVGFSLTVGVVFGFFPAWKAARLDPIEAMRRG